MNDQVRAVLAGERRYHAEQMDCLAFVKALPDQCVDLIFGSPPYEDSRYYGEIDFRLKGQAWVDWLVEFVKESQRVCKGLIALVVGHGKTEDWRWSAAPALLLADLHRAGCHLRNPPAYYRIGVSGSGQKDWLRADHETIVCVQCSAPGKPLPWSNNTALGHRPKWAPGGEMSNRTASGNRRNQWGGSEEGIGTRRANGQVQTKKRPSHRKGTYREASGKKVDQDYVPPALANPGNLAKDTYTADEVAALLDWYESGDVIKTKVGGGLMGHPLAHSNEAPFSLDLADFFVLSFCPPGGLVYEPFLGSGTTMHAAVQNHRRCLGTDLRASQIDLTVRRVQSVTPYLEVASDLRKAEMDQAQAAARAAALPQAEGA